MQVESATNELLEQEKIGQVNPSNGILELELIEYADEVGISPKRLEVFVSSITELHAALAIVHGIEGEKLTFRYFDSGSGLRVGIEDVKAIVETMSSLLSQWWDRIVYWRYENFDKKMTALSKTLAFTGTIHESVVKGAITQEEGENLKIRVFREVETLTGIGVTIPLTEGATIDRRQLLTEMRNTKLLSDGSTAESSGEPAASEPAPPKEA